MTITTDAIGRLLEIELQEELELWCSTHVPEAVAGFERVVPLALGGSWSATRAYVEAWTGLVDDLVQALDAVRPDLVLRVGDRLILIDIKRAASPASRMLLDCAAVEAPFSAWVTEGGIGVGTCASMAERLLSVLPDLNPPLLAHSAVHHWDSDEYELRRFRRNVTSLLEGDLPPLARIRDQFDLSLTQLGGLFGVRRQAVSQWLDRDVPSDRQEKVAAVSAIGEVLSHRLKAGLLPGIARRPAEAYEGLNMLEMITADRHHELLARVRGSFDWSVTA